MIFEVFPHVAGCICFQILYRKNDDDDNHDDDDDVDECGKVDRWNFVVVVAVLDDYGC